MRVRVQSSTGMKKTEISAKAQFLQPIYLGIEVLSMYKYIQAHIENHKPWFLNATCVCACMYVCMYLCMYVCIHVCVNICVCACVCVCVYMYVLSL